MSLSGQFEAQDKSNGAELPRYRCHKEVWALKIAEVAVNKPTIEELDRLLADKAADGDGIGGFLKPENPRYGVISVSTEFMQKHKPAAGMYLVVYKDGYRSMSPADAFEEGYTRV